MTRPRPRPHARTRACVIWFTLSPIFIEEVVDSAYVILAGREIRRPSIETESQYHFIDCHYIWHATRKLSGKFETFLSRKRRENAINETSFSRFLIGWYPFRRTANINDIKMTRYTYIQSIKNSIINKK